MNTETLLWQVRAYIYKQFADTTRAPEIKDAARHFNIEVEEAGRMFRELHKRHAILLEADHRSIRMANPFSAIRTDFRVRANGRTYYANCAWDMLGIPAALHCDAVIEAFCAESHELIKLHVIKGQVSASDLRIHITVPYSRWHDDLVFT